MALKRIQTARVLELNLKRLSASCEIAELPGLNCAAGADEHRRRAQFGAERVLGSGGHRRASWLDKWKVLKVVRIRSLLGELPGARWSVRKPRAIYIVGHIDVYRHAHIVRSSGMQKTCIFHSPSEGFGAFALTFSPSSSH